MQHTATGGGPLVTVNNIFLCSDPTNSINGQGFSGRLLELALWNTSLPANSIQAFYSRVRYPHLANREPGNQLQRKRFHSKMSFARAAFCTGSSTTAGTRNRYTILDVACHACSLFQIPVRDDCDVMTVHSRLMSRRIADK